MFSMIRKNKHTNPHLNTIQGLFYFYKTLTPYQIGTDDCSHINFANLYVAIMIDLKETPHWGGNVFFYIF